MVCTQSEKAQRRNHSLTIENRGEIRASGVKRIDYFSEEAVILLTDYGSVSVKGEKLYVDTLNSETGDLFVRGKINSVAYYERDEGKSWIKRIFR